MEVVTGYKRSYSVVIRKMLNDEILLGYPKVYPTATDVANGYFVLGGVQIPVMTDNELQTLTQSEYAARIALLKDYVIQQEGMNPFENQFNDNVVYDPTNCVPEIITTTTTTIEITTTTTTAGQCTSCVEYGYLYNRYVIEDTRNIANSDWHIPTYDEAYALLYYCDPYTGGGYFDARDCINLNGFGLRISGERSQYDGTFVGLESYTILWCSTADFGYGDGIYASSSDSYMWLNYLINEGDKQIGWSARLIKDSTSLTHGQTGTYAGNDGKVYCTVCINGQEWLAENLAETKYRNGDVIPLVSDGATWAGLASGARAAYNNNSANVGCGE